MLTANDYNSGNLKTVDVMNYEKVLSWCGNNNEALSSGLFADNRVKLKNIFGSRDFFIRLAFPFDVWAVTHKDYTYLLLSSKTKGTCIELITKGILSVDEDKVVGFLDWLTNRLITELKID